MNIYILIGYESQREKFIDDFIKRSYMRKVALPISREEVKSGQMARFRKNCLYVLSDLNAFSEKFLLKKLNFWSIILVDATLVISLSPEAYTASKISGLPFPSDITVVRVCTMNEFNKANDIS